MNRCTVIEILDNNIITTISRDYPKNIKVIKTPHCVGQHDNDGLFCFANANGFSDNIRYAISESVYTEYFDKSTPDIPLSPINLKSIYKVVKKFSHKKYWNEYSDSLFQFKYIKGYLKQMRINLKWLTKHLREFPDEIVIFRDIISENKCKDKEAKNEKEN